MGGEDHRHIRRHLVEFLDEHGTFGLQAFDHEAVVHDLVPDIDRRAVALQRPLDDLDRPVDPGAEPARPGQPDGQGPPDIRGRALVVVPHGSRDRDVGGRR